MSAFSKIQARLRAGDSLSVADLEAAIASDPACAAAFAELAAASRAGSAIDYASIEAATHFPRGLINAAIFAFATGGKVTGAHLVVEGTFH